MATFIHRCSGTGPIKGMLTGATIQRENCKAWNEWEYPAMTRQACHACGFSPSQEWLRSTAAKLGLEEAPPEMPLAPIPKATWVEEPTEVEAAAPSTSGTARRGRGETRESRAASS